MMNQLISIVVPVYNAEKFISKLINSVLKQTYTKFELLLIDDGSYDNSENIINSYHDDRIHYYKQKNCGGGFARNKGIEYAKGDYICFMDHDDYLEEDYLKELIDSLISNNSCLSMCEYKMVEDNKKPIIKPVNKNDTYNNTMIKALKKEFSYMALHNKLFIKAIILKNQIKFIETGVYGSDIEFVIHYLNCIDKVSFVEKPLYNYYRYQGSQSYNRLSHERFNDIWLKEENTINIIKTYIDKRYQKYISVLYTSYCLHILELLVHFKIYDERYKHCIKLLRKYVLLSVAVDDNNIKSKIKLLVLAISPTLILNK